MEYVVFLLPPPPVSVWRSTPILGGRSEVCAKCRGVGRTRFSFACCCARRRVHSAKRFKVGLQAKLLLKSPGDLSVTSALDLRPLGGDEGGAEFSTLLVQQILADECQLQVFGRSPPQSNIQVHVTGNVQGRQAVHVTKCAIQRQIMRQIDRRPEHELMARALAFVLLGSGVGATGP